MKRARIMKVVAKSVAVAAVAAVGIIGIGSAASQTSFASNEASSPRSLYLQHCSKCHGADGRADTPKGRETDADDLTSASTKRASTAKILRVITAGKGDMPGFSKKLTAAQIRQIAGYIRTL